MKRILFSVSFIFIFLFLPIALEGQWINNEWSNKYSGHGGYTVSYGHFGIDRTKLYRHLGVTPSGMIPVNEVSINTNAVGEGDLGYFFGMFSRVKDASISGHYFLPERITGPNNLSCDLKGFSVDVNFGKDIFQQNRFVDLLFFHGMSYGEMRLHYLDNNVIGYYKNPFWNLNFYSELRILIGGKNHGLNIGGRGGYKFDITKTRWKKHKNDALPDLPGTKTTAWFAEAFIGFY